MQSTDSMQSLSHYQWHFSHRTKRLQLVWKQKLSLIAKATLINKNGTEAIRFPELQIIIQSYSHQNSMVLAKKKKKTGLEINGTG